MCMQYAYVCVCLPANMSVGLHCVQMPEFDVMEHPQSLFYIIH